jgi:hypothetical protein
MKNIKQVLLHRSNAWEDAINIITTFEFWKEELGYKGWTKEMVAQVCPFSVTTRSIDGRIKC